MPRLNKDDLLDQRYRLEGFIGQGGFAEVWKATDTFTDTVHAIKVFAPDQGMNSNGIELFKRDYKLTANLRHPSLLIPTHYSVHEDSPFLVMPICEKGSLDVRLQQGPLSEDEIANVLKQVATGLHYMHSLEPSIVHRDIKTENVLVDDRGNYLITDFGISSETQQSLQKVTRSQQAVSVSYAPPERFETPPKSLPSGDVFSLGVMLFELCTGMLPWDGHGGLLLNQGAQLPHLPPHFSRRLNAIVQACLNPNYESRPTAKELQDWAMEYIRESMWPEIPAAYQIQASSSNHTGGGRKTQRMEDIQMPSGFGMPKATPKEEATAASPAPSPQKKEKNAGAVAGGIAVILFLAVIGYFSYDYFSSQKNRKQQTTLNTNTGKATSLLEESTTEQPTKKEQKKATSSNQTATPKPPVTSSGSNTSSPPQTQKPQQIEPKKPKGKPYKPIGSLQGIFEALGKGGMPYGQKKKMGQELLKYFTSADAPVITSVEGTYTDAETAQKFADRIITMPAPQIKIEGMEKEGNKVSKLVVEID